MWTPLVILVLGFHHFQRVHLQQDVCDIVDNKSAADACAMKKATGGSAVFQQLLPSFSPKGALYIQYGNVVVGGAQQLAPSRVFSRPSLSLSLVNGFTSTVGVQLLQRKMALACVDYNPQSRAVKLNWLQTGFTADQKSGELTSSSPPIVSYISPNPEFGTGTHEYIFLVIRENEGGLSAALGQNVSLGGLLPVSSDLKNFLNTNKLGDHLIAASFFKSTFDGQLIDGQVPSALARKQANVTAVTAAASNRTLDISAAPAVTQEADRSNTSVDAVEQSSTDAIRVVNNSMSTAATSPVDSQPSQNLTAQAVGSDSIVLAPQTTLSSNHTSQSERISNSSNSLDSAPPVPTANLSLADVSSDLDMPVINVTTQTQPPALASKIILANSSQTSRPMNNSLNISICSFASSAAQDACDMVSAFEGSSIVPKVVPKFQPIGGLYVQYGNAVVGGAQQMSTSRVAVQPTIKFTSGVPEYVTANKKYFLMLVDNSANSSAVSVSWAQSGVTIDSTTGQLASPADESALCSYIKPNPSQGGSSRNYIFLLFEQPVNFVVPPQQKALLISTNANNHESLTLDLSSFCIQVGLVSPVGGSFFKTSVTHQNLRRLVHRSFSRP